MKELGFALSPRPFNEIMRIVAYYPEHVLEVFAELKKSKVPPDNDSYRICISSFGSRHNLEGMERMLREMESQPHIVMDWCTYAVVADFYDRESLVDKATDALEKARVLLLKQDKDTGRIIPSYLLEADYRNVIKSLAKLGEVDEAMKFMDTLEASSYSSDYMDDLCIRYPIIEHHIKNGKLQDAFYKIQEWSGKWMKTGSKVDVNILSRLLCKEYLKVGNVFQAFKCFRGTVHAFENPPMVYSEIHPTVPMLFYKYLEQDCSSFFPLSCAGSAKPAKATVPFQDNPVHHPKLPLQENSTQPLNEARKMVMEWETYGNLNNLKMIIEGCCKKSFFVEAEAMAEAWTREKRSQVAEIWFVLASHYQLHGEMVRGLECMRRCFDLTPGLKGSYGMMSWTFVNVIEHSRGMNNALGRVYNNGIIWH